jgi:hypothetical protein
MFSKEGKEINKIGLTSQSDCKISENVIFDADKLI